MILKITPKKSLLKSLRILLTFIIPYKKAVNANLAVLMKLYLIIEEGGGIIN